MRFPLGAGINGLAAEQGEPVWTFDYLADPRIPHRADDDAVARRLGLRGMAAAPLRAPGGEVIGTLAISTAEPRIFEADDLDLLQGLADQAAIALTNSNLLARLTESEERYRYLVQNAPDVVWSIDADARITFLSDAVERLTGFRPEELLGQHFGAIVHESSRDVAEIDWTTAHGAPSQEVRGRLNLQHRDGSAVPAEFIAVASLEDDGTFAGANGSVRDMRERDRLERELRASEERYRTLASSSPDIVFATDAEGRYTFLSDRAGDARLGPRELARPALHGVRRARLRGRGASRATRPSSPIPTAGPLDADGLPQRRRRPGPARDQRRRQGRGRRARRHQRRGPRHLRARAPRARAQRSEERYRFLVQNSPDIVFSTDAEGHFTFLSAAIERLTGYRRDELIGQHFGTIVESEAIPVAGGRWDDARDRPGPGGRRRPRSCAVRDGRRMPVDVRAVGVTRRRAVRRHPGRGARRQRPGPARDASCAARPASWRPARSARTSPASCTTRSPRRCSR